MDEQIISTPTPESEAVAPRALPHPVTRAAKSTLFLVTAILLSISVGIGTLNNLSQGSLLVDVIELLVMIGMWIVYANASKTPVEKAIPANGLNMISGTVKAMRIITLVVSILLIVCALILIVLGAFAMKNEVFYEEFKQGYLENISPQSTLMIGDSILFDARDFVATPSAATVLLIVIGFGILFAAALLLVVFWFFFYKILHQFTYSVCENVKYGTNIEKASAVWLWLLVLGIISAVLSLSDLLASGPAVAAQICGAVLIRNNFCNK